MTPEKYIPIDELEEAERIKRARNFQERQLTERLKAAQANLETPGLPPLSREAYLLRQRLVYVLMSEPEAAHMDRIVRLIVRANERFERREAKHRAEVSGFVQDVVTRLEPMYREVTNA